MITAVSGQTNEVVVDLKRGATLHGQLDAGVPRPVRNGRVIAHVWPQGHKPEDSPPQWHAWSAIREDGSFDISSLPEGDLEVVALCNGFVNTNGPGKYKFIYPQKYVLGTNDLAITVGMEPTARLEVHVTDDQGKLLAGAHVSAWPNVRCYGEWAAVVLGSDLQYVRPLPCQSRIQSPDLGCGNRCRILRGRVTAQALRCFPTCLRQLNRSAWSILTSSCPRLKASAARSDVRQ